MKMLSVNAWLWCVLFMSLGLSETLSASSELQFHPLTSHAGVYHDVVNVGVIRSNGKALLIDSGEGSILRDAKKLGAGSIDWVLYTHYHRDECSGAPLLKKVGVKIGVPASEALLFRNATEFWLRADTFLYHRYDSLRPEPLVLRESVVPDRELRDGEVLQWQGISIQVVATPGHTDGSVTYLVDIEGKKIAFTGDLIYGPGQLWEFWSLQKQFAGMPADYEGFGGGMFELRKSLDLILSYKPSMLVPSHGVVMNNPAQAVSLLWKRLDPAMKNYFALTAWRVHERDSKGEPGEFRKEDVQAPYNVPMLPSLPARLPAWVRHLFGTSWYIQADDRSIFLLDCGYSGVANALDTLVKSSTVSGVDGIWISHYHDDHTQMANEIRRKYGAKVYAHKQLVDILEHPLAYSMPALNPESIHVDHPLSEGEVLTWRDYKMTAYYYPGQTIYHDGLLVEHGGTRVFMNGDSLVNWGLEDDCVYNREFLGRDGATNGFEYCIRLLLRLKPDVLQAAHYGAVPFSEEYLRRTLELLQKRAMLFSELFPWDDPNFGLDPYWIRAYPYRQTISKGQEVRLEARIYNHSDLPRRARVELRVPAGWPTGTAGSTTIAPHIEGKISLTAVAPASPVRPREVLALEVHFANRDLGEIAEAIVDYVQ